MVNVRDMSRVKTRNGTSPNTASGGSRGRPVGVDLCGRERLASALFPAGE